MTDKQGKKVDCSNILRNIEREIKCITYKLSTVIADGEYHNVVHPKYETEVEIIESTPIYCKIPCSNQYSPVKIFCLPKAKGDYKCYVSLTAHMPN